MVQAEGGRSAIEKKDQKKKEKRRVEKGVGDSSGDKQGGIFCGERNYGICYKTYEKKKNRRGLGGNEPDWKILFTLKKKKKEKTKSPTMRDKVLVVEKGVS